MLAPYQARSSLTQLKFSEGLALAMLKTNSRITAVMTGIAVITVFTVLFCAAIVNSSFTYAALGVLISGLVFLLYYFNERRLQEIRQAEAERRQHAEEMATIHMNTIESLA